MENTLLATCATPALVPLLPRQSRKLAELVVAYTRETLTLSAPLLADRVQVGVCGRVCRRMGGEDARRGTGRGGACASVAVEVVVCSDSSLCGGPLWWHC